ncbi:21981_t:CDS:2 [Entrophospora sp. SA101]|nr:21981_t:CDS:2 [Entrophospora sp. SA101]
MKIFVRTLAGKATILKVRSFDTMDAVKLKIQDKDDKSDYNTKSTISNDNSNKNDDNNEKTNFSSNNELKNDEKVEGGKKLKKSLIYLACKNNLTQSNETMECN